MFLLGLLTLYSLRCLAFDTIMQWADDRKRLGVRANAETSADAQVVLASGQNYRFVSN